MHRNAWDLQRSAIGRQSEVLNIIADYRFMAPPRLAARERLAVDLARHAVLRDGGAFASAQPGAARRWLGAQMVRLGAWLGGVAAPPVSQPMTREIAVVE
ncbi:MAG: hypothetical protein QOG89_1810 [Thermomicrobiales bacterium]|nr:hypothetical protein [Thermomicrobiales bacterium]